MNKQTNLKLARDHHGQVIHRQTEIVNKNQNIRGGELFLKSKEQIVTQPEAHSIAEKRAQLR